MADEKIFFDSCKKAFDEGGDVTSEDHAAALKSVANTLLLKEHLRASFANSNYPAKTADKLHVHGDDRFLELICSRILFLLTYQSEFDFSDLFERHSLSESVNQHLAHHAAQYSQPGVQHDAANTRSLSETLKLLFNLNQFNPDRRASFKPALTYILQILQNARLEKNPFQAPISYLINALLNIDDSDLEGNVEHNESYFFTAMFPSRDQLIPMKRLIGVLDLSVRYFDEENLEINAVPLLTLLRRLNEIAPEEVQQLMRSKLLPADAERDQPLGKSDTTASRLLKLSTSAVAVQFKEGASSLLFELSGKDPATFIQNVGYGYAVGFLTTHKIPIPELSLKDGLGGDTTIADGAEINPITGQRRDMEPHDPTLDMTDEEKEREAERLFVLFERLKATGVVNVTNPVEQAAKEGKLQ